MKKLIASNSEQTSQIFEYYKYDRFVDSYGFFDEMGNHITVICIEEGL